MNLNTSLQALLNDIIPLDQIPDLSIKSLAIDSREPNTEGLFFAYLGSKTDGRHYLQEAVNQGATVILCEQSGLEAYQAVIQAIQNQVRVIPVLHLQRHVSEIAGRFYVHPSRDLIVVGITGTNGKTSCTHFIAQALNKNEIRCAVIGTLGHGIPPHLEADQHTTPNALSLQKTLAEMRDQKIQVVAMEVSSHGLSQYRVDGVSFSIVVFTQLSRDHLDYHGSMEAYAAAKERLFHFPRLQAVVLNLDDAMGYRLAEQKRKTLKVYGYSQEANTVSDIELVRADQVHLDVQGFEAQLYSPWGEGKLESPLLGKFNISNLLAVISVLGIVKLPLTKILEAVSKLKTVAGRLELLGGGGLPQVVVDYSHTPDALEKALLTLKEHHSGKLWCVFGCGGERDAGKRPMMAAIAERYSDYVVLTDDNPRSESSAQILTDIQQGFSSAVPLSIIPDRAEAIKYAIQKASVDDMILIAGKGHEEYQLVGTERLAFSDKEQAEMQLENRRKIFL